MNGCTTCGGFAGRHDPIAHDAEPDTPPAVCCMHKRFVLCRDDADDCDISDHPADVEAIRRHQHDAEPQEDTVPEPTDELREALARWLFERDYRERGLASPEDADWDEWVERNREEWQEEADALLTDSPIAEVIEQRARERAAEELRAAADMDGVIMSMDWSVKAPLAGVIDAYAAMLRRRADALTRPDPGRC